MDRQLFNGPDQPSSSYFKPAFNKDYDANTKPGGGLWTSSWTGTGSEWTEWCIAEDFLNPYAERWFLLTPPPTARIYQIDTLADLKFLFSRYPRADVPEKVRSYSHPLGWINWVEMSLDYDAVHLTSRGNVRLHLSHPVDLNCWDAESTVWLNWVDFAVEEVAVPQIA